MLKNLCFFWYLRPVSSVVQISERPLLCSYSYHCDNVVARYVSAKQTQISSVYRRYRNMMHTAAELTTCRVRSCKTSELLCGRLTSRAAWRVCLTNNCSRACPLNATNRDLLSRLQIAYTGAQHDSCLNAGMLRSVARDLSTVRMQTSLPFVLCKYWKWLFRVVVWALTTKWKQLT
jgi:hypothetical protein